MSQYLNYLKNIFTYLLILSKVTMIILSFYYLINYEIYSITINVPLMLRSFSLIDLPLKLLESFNMSIIIFPLTIILLSFYYPDNNKLRILSGFCAIGGNLFSIGHLASKGLLDEYFKTFFLTVYNAPSLETKIKLFSDFFNQRINIHTSTVQNIIEFKSFVQEQLNNNFDLYVNTLKRLPQLDIIPYASKIADQLHNNYIQSLISLNTPHNVLSETSAVTSSFTQKMLFGLGSGMLIIVVIFVGYKTYENAVLLKQVGSEIMDMGRRFTRAIGSITGTDTLLATVNNNVTKVTQEVATVATKVNNLDAQYAILSGTVSGNAAVLKDLIDRVKSVATKVNNLVVDVSTQPISGTTVTIDERLPQLFETINNQIESLARGGLNTNNNVTALAKNVDNLENKISEIVSQRISTITNNITNNEKAQLAAQAADMRWIEEARNKIKDFDALTAMKEIKSFISQQTKPIADEMSHKVDNFINTAKTTIHDNKTALTNKINNVSSEVTEVKNIITEKIKSENVQANVIQNIDDRLKVLETNNNNLNEGLSKTKIDLDKIKEDYQTLATAVNTSIMEMQITFDKTIKQINEMFTEYKQYITSTVRLAQNVRTDNVNINNGNFVPRPFISGSAALGTNIFTRRFGPNSNNNNN